MYNQLGAISPLDGRYANGVKELNAFFSEAAIMRYRVYIEIEYLIALSFEKNIKEFPALTKEQIEKKIRESRKTMEKAAKDLDFIEAARLRDEIKSLKNQLE